MAPGSEIRGQDVSKQVKTVAPMSIGDDLRSNIFVAQWDTRDQMG
jgi:hypothetical protein